MIFTAVDFLAGAKKISCFSGLGGSIKNVENHRLGKRTRCVIIIIIYYRQRLMYIIWLLVFGSVWSGARERVGCNDGRGLGRLQRTTRFLVYRCRRRRTTKTIIIKYTIITIIIIMPFKATGRPPPRSHTHAKDPADP